MRKDKSEHAFLPTLKSYLADGKIHRRQFLREATLLGLSSAAAYAFADKISGGSLVDPALAQTSMPKGGRVRVANRVFDVKDPHVAVSTAASNVYRQVLDFLAVTDWDNVTRPALLEKWEASPDLKTWTLSVRKNVKWHKGRDFTADDVIWNFNRVLDPKTGSSMLGLMRSYMLTETETGEKDDKGNPKKVSKLWDAQAIQKIDSHTVRLNCKSAQLAIPEHLFHYPFAMLDLGHRGLLRRARLSYDQTRRSIRCRVCHDQRITRRITRRIVFRVQCGVCRICRVVCRVHSARIFHGARSRPRSSPPRPRPSPSAAPRSPTALPRPLLLSPRPFPSRPPSAP